MRLDIKPGGGTRNRGSAKNQYRSIQRQHQGRNEHPAAAQPQGKCGAHDKGKEGKCGEGKCGEGKCGGDKKGEDPKSGA